VIREKLAELYESEQQWSKAAQMSVSSQHVLQI
jgi:hypothetical protein